jgi:hypothetical protein
VGQQYPEVKDWGIRRMTFYHWFVQDQLRTALPVLLGAVVLVLLNARANVANLLLSRAAARQNEIAAVQGPPAQAPGPPRYHPSKSTGIAPSRSISERPKPPA